MIAGEGLAGVLIALLVFAQDREWIALPASWHFAEGDFAWISGVPGTVLGLAVVAGIAALLYRAGLSATPPPPIDVEAQGPEGGG